MLLIAGLGNYGTQYNNTRHNAGFICLDKIAEQYNASPWLEKFSSHYAKIQINNRPALLVKPQTFMNNSGKALLSYKTFFKIDVKDMVVIHDDIDVEIGRLKAKIGGGAAGHNGLKSIDSTIGKEYMRIRMGISKPQSVINGESELSNFVLGKFLPEESEKIAQLSAAIAKNIALLATEDGNKMPKFIEICNK
jgi:PTH1 family peptidyl-tRNA hydrolase